MYNNLLEVLDEGFYRVEDTEWNYNIKTTIDALFWLKRKGFTLSANSDGISKPFIRVFKDKTFHYEESPRFDKLGMMCESEVYLPCRHHSDKIDAKVELRLVRLEKDNNVHRRNKTI